VLSRDIVSLSWKLLAHMPRAAEVVGCCAIRNTHAERHSWVPLKQTQAFSESHSA